MLALPCKGILRAQHLSLTQIFLLERTVTGRERRSGSNLLRTLCTHVYYQYLIEIFEEIHFDAQQLYRKFDSSVVALFGAPNYASLQCRMCHQLSYVFFIYWEEMATIKFPDFRWHFSHENNNYTAMYFSSSVLHLLKELVAQKYVSVFVWVLLSEPRTFLILSAFNEYIWQHFSSYVFSSNGRYKTETLFL